jgi:hypothetical protein
VASDPGYERSLPVQPVFSVVEKYSRIKPLDVADSIGGIGDEVLARLADKITKPKVCL